MTEVLILSISVLLQFIAAFLAIRLIRITKHRIAWLLIAAAILLMAARRSITLYNSIASGMTPNLTTETVALIISALMLLGMIWIAPMFLAIKKTHEELQYLLKSMINGFVLFESVFDDNGKFVSFRYLYTNDAYEHVIGVTSEHVRGKTVHEVWPETEPEWIERFGSVAITGEAQEFDLYHNPTKKLYHCNVYRPWNTPERFCLIFENITQRNKVQEDLRAMDLMASSSSDLMTLLDKNYIYLAANDAYLEAFGKAKGEVIGHPITDVFQEDVFEKGVKPFAKRAMAGEDAHFQTWLDFPTRGRRHLDVVYSPYIGQDKEVEGFVVCARDITDRKQVEEAIKKQEEILNQTGMMAKIGGWEHDLVTGEGFWTQALYDIIEIDSPPPPGPNEHLSYYQEKEREILRAGYQKAIETGEPFDLELQVHTAKGRPIWCRAMGAPVYDDAGNCIKMRGTFQDITKRKTAELELANYRQHLEELIEQRTAELQRTVNLMAGREVRMAELKKDMHKLREQLAGADITPIVEEIKKSKQQEQDGKPDEK